MNLIVVLLTVSEPDRAEVILSTHSTNSHIAAMLTPYPQMTRGEGPIQYIPEIRVSYPYSYKAYRYGTIECSYLGWMHGLMHGMTMHYIYVNSQERGSYASHSEPIRDRGALPGLFDTDCLGSLPWLFHADYLGYSHGLPWVDSRA